MTDPKRNDSLADRASDALDTARERAIDAYDSARERADKAGKQAGKSVGDNPLLALGAGIGLGALIAALLPTSRRERDLVGPYADRVRDKATDAVASAREAGTARLGELGLTKDAGSSVIKQVVDGATDALKASAKAAASSVKSS